MFRHFRTENKLCRRAKFLFVKFPLQSGSFMRCHCPSVCLFVRRQCACSMYRCWRWQLITLAIVATL